MEVSPPIIRSKAGVSPCRAQSCQADWNSPLYMPLTGLYLPQRASTSCIGLDNSYLQQPRFAQGRFFGFLKVLR